MCDDRTPLASAQERVWFLQSMDEENRSYQFQATVSFDGPLDATALERALETIAHRHEILRTTFPDVDGVPYQRVHPPEPLNLPVVDVTGASDPDVALRTAIAAATEVRLDVRALPLVRWTLVRLAADRHVLVHVEHHLLHDGWSFYVFLSELAALYRALSADELPDLSPAPQFSAYARAERERDAAGAFDEHLAYWTQTLAGAPSRLGLRTDRPRPRLQTYAGAALVETVPAPLGRALERIGAQHGATLFMTAFAAFVTLLQRLTGEDDLCVGTGVANRDLPETERLLGMIVNNIVLRADLSGDPRFTEVVERVARVALDAFAHRDAPFHRVVDALKLPRDPSANPLFTVMFSFHDSPRPELDFGPVHARLDQTQSNASAKFDLNVVVIPEPDESLTLKWEYNTDLFEEATMRRTIGHFVTLLEAIADEPDRRISRYPLLRERERRTLLERFAGEAQPYLREETVHRLVERRADAQPERIALELGEERLTYRQLDALANRLAHRLLREGIRHETLVAIALDRSFDAIVAMLAALKAGAAFVPLDLSLPRERLAFVVEDAAPGLVLTHARLRSLLPPSAAVLALDENAHAIDAEPSTRPHGGASATSLAYVMYTSGTTGTSKGVCVEHRNVVRLACGLDDVALRDDDLVLANAPLAFDASTFEIWGTLSAGSRLVLAPAGRHSLFELGDLILDSGASVLWLTAPLFREMVDHNVDALRNLRVLVTGGDIVSAEHARALLDAAPACRLVNGYGPTENTTFTTTAIIDRAAAQATSLPIGRPIANTRVYVLDAHRAPVPIGVAGELYAGGDGVARGYLRRPELTAERFLPDPFVETPAARMYRTGDRVRFRSDGTLEFLGRTDHQVKIRGFRLELGEVEAALLRLPGVAAAAASVCRDDADHATLIAHVVAPELAPDAAPAALRDALRAAVPEYAVPARIIVCDALPTNARGKVDRAALAAAAAAQGAYAESAAAEPPQPGIETTVAAIWREVIGATEIGRHDEFFALGGDSLAAMRIAARLGQALGAQVPLRLLFEHRTVATLAVALETAGDASAEPRFVSVFAEFDDLDDLSESSAQAL